MNLGTRQLEDGKHGRFRRLRIPSSEGQKALAFRGGSGLTGETRTCTPEAVKKLMIAPLPYGRGTVSRWLSVPPVSASGQVPRQSQFLHSTPLQRGVAGSTRSAPFSCSVAAARTGWGILLILILLLTLSHVATLSAQETPIPPVASDVASSSTFLGMDTSGTLDIGYRWTTGLTGSEDLYRSLVNLGQGPRLLGANLNLESPLGGNKYVDRVQLNASSWGGDPYNTVRLFAEKAGHYQFSFDYRKVDYFNFIPSFANPLLGQGIFLGQHSFDSTRRTMDFELTLRPGARVSPFLAYSRNSGFGPGITTFTADGNEFAVTNRLRDTSDYYRGGIIFNLTRLNLTLEQGLLAFRDDQRIFQDQGNNRGNRRPPLLGQNIVLNQLDENYRVRGRTPVSRVQLTATPWKRLTLAGRFVYSQPDLDFDYDRRSVGNFLSFDVLRVFTGELAAGSAEANRPHILGNLSVEFRPHDRISILETLVTDRFHISSTSSLGRSLTGTRPLSDPPDPNNTFNTESTDSNRFAVNLNQNQLESVISLTSRLSVRGGYRYMWADTQLQSLISGDQAQAIELHRNVGLAGFGFRLPRKADLSLDLEIGEGNRVFSRTDVLDYRKLRVRGRYRPWESLTLSGSFSFMDHENNRPDLDYDFQNRGFTLSASLAPGGGKRLAASFDYSRADLTSDILFISPQLLIADRSLYIEDSHFAGVNVEVGVVHEVRLSLGYGVLSTTGSRPLNYHQPRAGIEVPLHKRVSWTTEWRYYGYNEKGLTFQDFHNHLITAGLRFRY